MKRPLNPWSRFWRLNGSSRGVVIEAAAGLAVTRVGLRLAGLRTWQTALARFASESENHATRERPDESSRITRARTIARLQESAARHVIFRPTCLEQSLTLWCLLRRRGIPAELCVGARKEAGKFEAHAWVECEGVAINATTESEACFERFAANLGASEHATLSSAQEQPQ
jgi:Transglutaminase-like superfamily